MQTRRTFFQSLAAAPLALLGVKLAPQLFHLPVGCDLSMSSLQWALNEGTQRGFGLPRTLIIGPENIFPARELLGRNPKYTTNPVINALFEHVLIYRVTRELPMNCWRVEFEHGVVESQGP